MKEWVMGIFGKSPEGKVPADVQQALDTAQVADEAVAESQAVSKSYWDGQRERVRHDLRQAEQQVRARRRR